MHLNGVNFGIIITPPVLILGCEGVLGVHKFSLASMKLIFARNVCNNNPLRLKIYVQKYEKLEWMKRHYVKLEMYFLLVKTKIKNIFSQLRIFCCFFHLVTKMVRIMD